jgi:hypothetical protein
VLQSIRKLQEMADRAAVKVSKREAGIAEERMADARALCDRQKTIEKCELEKFSNVDAMMAGTISKADYQDRWKTLNDQEAVLKKQIAEAEKQDLDIRM